MNDDTYTHTLDQTGVGGIAASILDQAPEPMQHAIEQASQDMELDLSAAEAPATEIPRVVLGELDQNGESWNPEIHSTGADGKGVKTARGLWRRRRGLGTSRTSLVAAARRGAVSPSPDDTQSRAAGVACAHTVFMMGRALGGEEWSPRIDAERNEVAMMERAWGDYFVAKGYTEFPPGLALSIALFSYGAPRFTMPVTQSRLSKFKVWTVSRYTAWKLKRQNRAQATKDIDAIK